MNVVVGSIVAADMLQRVPRKLVAAVVVDSLERGEAEEKGALSQSHTGHLVR